MNIIFSKSYTVKYTPRSSKTWPNILECDHSQVRSEVQNKWMLVLKAATAEAISQGQGAPNGNNTLVAALNKK